MTRPYEYNPANVGKRESSDGENTVTLYLGIGNSDGKLTQREWSKFVKEMDRLIRYVARPLYGWWHSLPDAPWQNATVAFMIDVERLGWLRKEVHELRQEFRQDSVAWAVAPVTEFV